MLPSLRDRKGVTTMETINLLSNSEIKRTSLKSKRGSFPVKSLKKSKSYRPKFKIKTALRDLEKKNTSKKTH